MNDNNGLGEIFNLKKSLSNNRDNVLILFLYKTGKNLNHSLTILKLLNFSLPHSEPIPHHKYQRYFFGQLKKTCQLAKIKRFLRHCLFLKSV